MAVECALLVEMPDEGPSTSPGMLFGGVSKLPTLAMVVGACVDCEALMVLKEEYLCMGGGGSSKLPSWAA